MRLLYFICLFPLFCSMLACSEPEDMSASVDQAITYDEFEKESKHHDSEMFEDGGWVIVTRLENESRVYWFLAPDINKVSPALFKKTIHAGDEGERETLIASKCDAPKPTCDAVMARFKSLSKKYK